jgi:hypothetical protein
MAFKMKGYSGYRNSSPKKSRSAFKQDPPPSDDDFTIGEAEDVWRRSSTPWIDDKVPTYSKDVYSQNPDIQSQYDRDTQSRQDYFEKTGRNTQGMEIDPRMARLIQRELKSNKDLSPTTRALYRDIVTNMLQENQSNLFEKPIHLRYDPSKKEGSDKIFNIGMRGKSTTTGNPYGRGLYQGTAMDNEDLYNQFTTADLDQLQLWKKQLEAGQGYKPPVGSLDPVMVDQIPTDDPRLSPLPPRPEEAITLPTREVETIQGPGVNMDLSRDNLEGTVEAEFPQMNFTPEGSSTDRAALIAQLKNAPMGSKLREQLYNDLNWAQDHTTTGYKGPQSNLGKMGAVRGTTPPPPSSEKVIKSTKKDGPKLTPKPKPTAPNLQKNISPPQKGKQTYSSITERGKAAQEKRKARQNKREARKKQRLKNRGGQKFHIADVGLEIKEGLDSIFGGV